MVNMKQVYINEIFSDHTDDIDYATMACGLHENE